MPTPRPTAAQDDEPIQYQCRHIKPDGHRCGSPSLREENFCFYHRTARRCGPRQPQVATATARKASTFELPSPADLADCSGLQLAVALLLHRVAHNESTPVAPASSSTASKPPPCSCPKASTPAAIPTEPSEVGADGEKPHLPPA